MKGVEVSMMMLNKLGKKKYFIKFIKEVKMERGKKAYQILESEK